MNRGPRKAGNWTLRLALIAVILTVIIGMAASMSPGGLGEWDVARAIPLSILLLLFVMRLAVSTQPLGRAAKQFSFFLILGTVLCIVGMVRADFRAARAVSSIGLVMIVALFFGGFIAVGGEWFGMWRSTAWNGLDTAFRNGMLAAITLILIHVPVAGWTRRSATVRA